MRNAKFLLFACAAVALAFIVGGVLLLAADMYVHHRAARSAGLNMWGYRGPVAARKRPGETRVAMLGGSTAFGYGVTWDHAVPALLDRELNAAAGMGGAFTVLNLGYNNEGAYSFRFTLEDYAYLRYDTVVLYEGYNDLLGDNQPNLSVFRHGSPLFLLTGYMPILPLVFQEKAMLLRSGGDLKAAYEHRADAKTVFSPGFTTRMNAAALEAAASLGQSLEGQLARVSRDPLRQAATPGPDDCAFPWTSYCASTAAAIDYALSRHSQVVVAAQPRLSGTHADERQVSQQKALADMLRRRFVGRGVVYVDLGDAVDLTDPIIAPDGMHLNYRGNLAIARRLVVPVRALAGRDPAGRPGK